MQTDDESYLITVTDWHNVFHVVNFNNNSTYYWYNGNVYYESSQLNGLVGDMESHNQRVASTELTYYCANTIHQNIIKRSDGWLRDFGSDVLSMFPPSRDIEVN